MGRLIVLEGIDGSGKDTQNRLLAQYLSSRGLSPLSISFPDYDSPSSYPVRMYLHGEITPDPFGVNAYAASSFYAVDRYISFKRDWEREYLSGRLILANRYTTSNVTHQMEKLPPEEWGPFMDWLCDFEYGRLGLPKPDLVVYLDMHPQVSQRLLEKRYSGNTEKKDIHERDTSYLAHCRQAALAAASGLGWQVVRCFDEDTMEPLDVDTIQEEVRRLCVPLLGE